MKTKITILFLLAIFSLNFSVINNADTGAGSLRQAITDANASSSTPHTITFGGSYTITLGSALPTVGKTTTIDGDVNTIEINTATSANMLLNSAGVFLTLKNITFNRAIVSAAGPLTATGCTFKNANPAAVKVNGITFTATSCTFDSNTGGAGQGSAITTIAGGSIVSLTSCKITNNSSTGGAAVYVQGNTVASKLEMINCIVSGNTNSYTGSSAYYGGGIASAAATTTITNCQISSNTANRGGGVALLVGGATAKSSLAMTGCTVSGNSLGSYIASAFGGGIYIQGGNATSPATAYFTDNCTFTNCTISGNSTPAIGSPVTTSAGGGIQIGGGGNTQWGTPSFTFTNCTIYGNNVQGNPASAISGGGIDRTNGTAVINYCIILNNNSNSTAGGRNINATAGWSTSTTGRNMYEGSASWNSSTITGNVTQSGNYTWSEILNTTLADNGGSTALPDGSYVKTHALVAGTSLQTAIDPDATGLSGLQTTDQRGTGRDALPDMGAYESMLPGVPTAVTVTRNNVSGQLSVAFTAPSVSTKGGASISNYKYSTDGGSTFTALSSPQTTSPFIISGLTNGTTYNVQIKAVNSNGDGVPCVSKTGTPNVATISGATTATPFTTTYGTASDPQSFSISGANLLGAITATAPAGFEVSSDGTTYGATATYARSLIDFTASGTVYIRLKATAAVSGTYNSQNIVLSTSGATANITTAASGNTVSPATGSIAAGNLSSPGLTDAELANTDLTLSSGEFIIDATKTVRSLTIATGAKLTHSSGTLTATNGITLESDATGSATLMDSYSTPTISATVKQYVTAGRNWYMSAPVSAADYSWLNRGTSVQGWDEANKAWVPVTEGTLVRGKGYVQVATTIVSPPSTTGTTGTVNVTGTTNSGDVAITVSRTESGTSRGFNLVGNPYPSYLKWTGTDGFITDATNDSISTSFWFRTKNSSDTYVFTTYNGSSHLVVGGTTVNSVLNEYIPPMQAFWIRVNANTAVSTHNVVLTFKNNMRVHGVGDNNKFKAPKVEGRQLMRLKLENGTQSDEALIYFDAAADNVFDNYDSPKIMNNSTTLPDLYTTVGTERLAINGLNDFADNMELPLGFTLKAAAAGLKLKVSELSNFAAGTRVYLLDKEQSSQTELLPSTEYTFNITASTVNNENRFSLLFRAPSNITGIDNVSNGNLQIYVDANNQLVIRGAEKSNYAIYNAVGQLIENGVTMSNSQTSNFKLQKGVYVVKVNNQSTRVILK